MRASHAFAREDRRVSWFHLISTFGVIAGAAFLAAQPIAWPLRVLASLLMGLTLVRGFILVHDLHHGAIFKDSRLATWILDAYGLLLVTPRTIWRSSHNYHHAHTARSDSESHGAFTIWTTEQWRRATRLERIAHVIERHPLTILLGYVTVFLLNFGLLPFFREPRRHADSAVAFVLHVGLGAGIWLVAGPLTFLFAFLLPFLMAGAFGAYLFYVQHAFEGVVIHPKDAWSHTTASLEGSSYLKLGPVMRWFTGNIGFHHVHHLNPRIPFYRLPEAMRAIPELQQPTTVTLGLGDIRRSFRLKLWDATNERMVGYRHARRTRTAAVALLPEPVAEQRASASTT